MTAERLTIEALNGLDRAGFVDRLGAIFEHSRWIAEGAFGRRPFADRAALLAAMRGVVEGAGAERQLALIAAHPELAVARPDRLGANSTREQTGAGLDRLSEPELARFRRLNRAYRDRFGFPFVIAVAGLDKTAIIAALKRRLDGDRPAEIRAALDNIYRIAEFRLARLLAPPAAREKDGSGYSSRPP